MSYKIKFRREAQTDIKKAKAWYEEQREGLGEVFYEAVKERINFLSDNPYAYTSRHKEIRQALVRGYPYIVHYLIEENKKYIYILAVAHTSRHPRSWREREQ